MSRTLCLLYGLLSHGLFLGLYAYMACFVADFFVPKTIDTGLPGQGEAGAWVTGLFNFGLLTAFALQHSIMARPGFKRWLTRFVPQPIERSTYVMVSNLVMVAILYLWQPMGGVVWQVENETLRTVIWGLFVVSWLSIPVYTFLLNHFDLFGARQVWRHFRGLPQAGVPFRTPGIYRFVRHPIYLGWMMAFWITPTMTVGHLLWAGGCTIYMLIAIPFEERDLVDHLGEDYQRYRQRVPGLLPVPGRGVRDVADVRGETAA